MSQKIWRWAGCLAGAITALAGPAMAAAAKPALLPHQVPLVLDSAGEAWMISATALVLLMTVPGLALFYGGMVRRKNIIATITQQVAITALITVLWMVAGYSLAFGKGSDSVLPILGQIPFPKGWVVPHTMNDFVGSLDAIFFRGVRVDTANMAANGLPEPLFAAYQLTFAIITPALITGAFAERMKFSAVLLFMTLWHFLVYCPIAHWVWGGGFLGSAGALDFAGGSVVHLNSGVAGLVCALFLGKRVGYGETDMSGNSLVRVMIGASLLFVGWIGFNAGSANASNGLAAMALLNTMIGACAAALGWMVVEWIFHSKPTLLGVLSGLVAGLVGITPAAGFVDPMGALIVGLVTGPVCYGSAVWVKKLLGYDDSLDAFGIHGVGGAAGALLTGALATTIVNPLSKTASLWLQVADIAWTFAWSAAMTLIILIICRVTTGVRVSKEAEELGLDAHLHGEVLAAH
jgi:Amt family ammonium transporter